MDNHEFYHKVIRKKIRLSSWEEGTYFIPNYTADYFWMTGTLYANNKVYDSHYVEQIFNGFDSWALVDEKTSVLAEPKTDDIPSGCQCGAHSVGFILASRAHSAWCAMYLPEEK